MCRLFFFFKQKTAYELRISDWSSDVCSSDLAGRLQPPLRAVSLWRPTRQVAVRVRQLARHSAACARAHRILRHPRKRMHGSAGACAKRQRRQSDGRFRSDEHTSELQSLMRISYAVFCLKKKKKSTLQAQ